MGAERRRYGPPDPSDGAGARHISAATTGLILRYVKSRAGEEGVRRVLELAGDSRPLDELYDPKRWSTYDQAIALFEAAAEVVGDPHVGRLIGEETLRQHTGTPVEAVLRDLGSPGEVLRNIAATTAKFAVVSAMEAVEIAEDHAVVSARCLPGFVRHPIFCDYVAGQLSQVSILFGMPAASVVEEECQTRGDGRCLYRVVWTGAEAADPLQQRVRYLEGQVADLTSRFAALQTAAAELVSADGLDTVLSRIATLAGEAVRAQRYLLVVQPSEGGSYSFHHDGMTGAEAAELAAEIMSGPTGGADVARIVVDVRSARRHYGQLVAVGPDGVEFFPAERRLLESYGRMAAAALDSTTALEEARKRGDTTARLLDLARSLANLADGDEVCQRVVRLVPSLAGCDRAAMFLWDAERSQMRLAALEGWDPEFGAAVLGFSVSAADTPEVSGMVSAPGPRFYRLGSLDPFLEQVLSFFRVEACAVVPIMSGGAGGAIHGSVVAGWERAPVGEPGADMLERMGALADHAAAAFQNVSLIQKVRHQALHDALTGLPNQTLFEDRAEHAMARAARRSGQLALLFVDLDGFKAVNDGLGHAAGDDLLQQVARRLVESLRAPDSVARLGGDEFLVLLEDLADVTEAEVVAAKLIDALRPSFTVQGTELLARASIGIAVHPRDGADYETLLRNADAAMYAVKRGGRNGYAVYSPASQVSDRDSFALARELVAAVEAGELVPYYQPEVELATGTLVAVEALVRWEHPQRGLLLPGDFFDAAAQHGILREIDYHMLRRACADGRRWQELECGVTVAVNLSERHWADPAALLSFVESALSESGLRPQHLELELTETVRLAYDEAVLEALRTLRGWGVRFCLDDFGTGYSMLDRLRRFSVDKVKVAREFLVPAEGDDGDTSLLATMVSLGHALGAEVVAEGVETDQQLAAVREAGFDLAQGYLIGLPADRDAVDRLLDSTPRRVLLAGPTGG